MCTLKLEKDWPSVHIKYTLEIHFNSWRDVVSKGVNYNLEKNRRLLTSLGETDKKDFISNRFYLQLDYSWKSFCLISNLPNIDACVLGRFVYYIISLSSMVLAEKITVQGIS